MKGSKLWVCTALVLAMIAAGCSNTDKASTTAPKDPSTARVSPESGAEVVAGDLTVSIPDGSVSAPGTVQLEREPLESFDDIPEFIDQLGDPAGVELVDTELIGEAELRFELDESPGEDPLVVVWQDPAGGWQWLPTETSSDGTSVSATTDHFSGGFLGRIDVQGWAYQQKERLVRYATGRSDVTQPGCGDEDALRGAGVSVSSDSGDSVKWCVGVEDGRNVMRVANNRRTYTQVTYPEGWEVLDGGPAGISLDALVRGTSGWVEGGIAPDGSAVRLLSGGDTLTLAMPENPSATVTAQIGTTAWLLSGVKFGLEVYAAVAGAAKSELGRAASSSWERFLGEVNTGDPSKGWNSALRDCLISLTDEVTDRPMELETFSETGSALLKFAWGCVPAMMKADLQASGVSFFGAGVVLAAVGAVVGAVLTALHLLTTGLREIWDSLASFGGESDVIYDIRLRTAVLDVRNMTYPADSCNVDGWASSPPIEVVDGEGSAGDRDAELPGGGYAYADIYQPELVGYSDLDGDGDRDAVVLAFCGAGGTYADAIVMPFTMDGGAVALLGGNIAAVATDAEHLDLVNQYGGTHLSRIIGARVEGNAIVVDESYDATGEECQACHSGRASVRWEWNDGWTSTLVR